MATSYPAYPDGKRPTLFEEGLEFQDFVIDILCRELGLAVSNYSSRKWQWNVGENKQGIEIKLDTRMLETKQLSIEVGEKTKKENPNYAPSGILRNDNAWLYIQGNKEKLFIFAKSILVGLYRSNRYQVHEKATIKTFYLPIDDAHKYAAKVIDTPGIDPKE